MYRCLNCENEFDEPAMQYYMENLDGERGIERYTIPVCPSCGSDEIEEQKET